MTIGESVKFDNDCKLLVITLTNNVIYSLGSAVMEMRARMSPCHNK